LRGEKRHSEGGTPTDQKKEKKINFRAQKNSGGEGEDFKKTEKKGETKKEWVRGMKELN